MDREWMVNAGPPFFVAGERTTVQQKAPNKTDRRIRAKAWRTRWSDVGMVTRSSGLAYVSTDTSRLKLHGRK